MNELDLALIERAAEAAGYTTFRMGPLGGTAVAADAAIPGSHVRVEARRDGAVILNCNPLTDDAQAMGLKQLFHIRTGGNDGAAWAQLKTPDESTPYAVFQEAVIAQVPEQLVRDEHRPQQHELSARAQATALRRVIVRAAAHRVRPDPDRIASTHPI